MDGYKFRKQPNDGAARLWSALRARKTPVGTPELSRETGLATGYTNRLLNAWAGHGLIIKKETNRTEGLGQPVAVTFMPKKAMADSPPTLKKDGTIIMAAMSPEEFEKAQKTLGLTDADFGEALGWTRGSGARSVRRFRTSKVIDKNLADKVKRLLDKRKKTRRP